MTRTVPRAGGVLPCLVLGLLAAAGGPVADEPADGEDVVTSVEVHAFFAKFPKLEPPVERLRLFPADVSSAPLRAALDKSRAAFDAEKAAVAGLWKDADHDAHAMLMAAVNVLRTEGSWWSRHFGERADAESAFHRRDLTWLVTIVRLHFAEARLRAAAETYYVQHFAQAYPILSASERRVVLDRFAKRLDALQKARERTFRAIETRRLQVYRDLLQRLEKKVTGDDADARVALDARASIESVRDVWHYEWLLAETATHLTIYGRLLAAEEVVVAREQLHPALFASVRASPRSWPVDASSPAVTEARLAIVRLRARRAQLTEVNRALQVEAAYRCRVSILLGGWNVVKDAGGKAWQVAKGGVADPSMKALDIYAQPAALIAIAYKLLGDSFSLLVSTPLKDTVLQASKDVLGTGWTTSDQDHFAEYEKQMKPVVFRMRLFARIAEEFDAERCRAWIAYFGADESGKAAGGAAPPGVDAVTLRSLVADSDFIAATQGGLPAILEPLVDDPRVRAGLVLRSAQYQIRADFQAATRRLAASRGQQLKPGDLASVKTALDKALGPVNPVTGWRDPYVQQSFFYRAVPFAAGIKALLELPKITKFLVEELRGKIGDENAYMERLGHHVEWIGALLPALKARDFDFGRLHAEAPDAFSKHVALLAQSPAYVSHWMRLREDENERVKLWRAAQATGGEKGDLTARGRRLLATDHLVQEMDLATLAYHASLLRLEFLAHTREYTGAALQVRELPLLDLRRRRAKGEPARKIDYAAVEDAFRREALREELIASYEELYHASLKEVVLKVGARALSNMLFGVDGAVGAGAAEAAFGDNTGEELWKAFNPWAGKLDAGELKGLLTGAFSDSIASITAHYGAQALPRFQKGEIENAVNVMIAVSAEARAAATQRLFDATAAWFVPKRELDERYARMGAAGDALARYREEQIAPLQKELAELDPADHDSRMAIANRIHALEVGTEMLSLRAQAAAALADLDGSAERLRAAEEEANEIARLLANGTATAAASEAVRGLEGPADARTKSVGDRLAAAGYLRKLAYGFADAEDLARLTRPDDPLRLEGDLFRLGLHLSFLRRSLQRAAVGAPDAAPALRAVSHDLDAARRRRLRTLLAEFVATTPEGAQVARIDHDGAQPDGAEYRGIDADLNLLVQVKKGGNTQDVAAALERFLAEKRHPLGTPAALVTSVAVHDLDTESNGESPSRLVGRTSVWDAGQPISTSRADGTPLGRLSEDELRKIEESQGFRADHAEGMHEYAQRMKSYLVVRDGNPQSVRHFDDPDAVAKPMTCKAKTQKVGPDAGLVVDPTHAKQAAEWKKALDAARAGGDGERLAELTAAHAEALATWEKYGAEMKKAHHYVVDEDGRVRKPVTVRKDGAWVTEFRKVHGDYDLHGVFHVSGEKATRIPFGDGTRSTDLLTKGFREQLNWGISRNGKEFVLHGGQDDWLHDGKLPDPPVTVFLPSGGKPVRLETAADMRRFYEKVMRVQWEYAVAAAQGALASQVRVAPTTVVGGQTFRSRAVPAWIANFDRYRGGVLVGDGEAVWRDVPREHAAALSMDMARQLAFLTDPRYRRDAVAALAGDAARKQTLGAALARADRFLRLVDAWILGDEAGHALYAERADDPRGAYYAAVVRDARALCARDAKVWRPLGTADLALLEQLAALQGHADVWSVPGLTLTRAQELLDWMRAKSIDLVAAGVPLWQHNFEALAARPTTDVGRRALEAVRDAVAIATENREGVPLLRPPLVLRDGRVAVLDVEAYRAALSQAVAAVTRERAALVSAQAGTRTALIRANSDKALDEAARKAIASQLAAGLSSAPQNKTWTQELEVGLWALYAELLLSARSGS